MHLKRSLRGPLIVVSCLLASYGVGNALAGTASSDPSPSRSIQQIWLDPLPPHTLAGVPGDPDFMQLFAPDATWPEALPGVKVFELYQHFVLTAPAADLRHVLQFLAAHHIQLAVGGQALTAPTPLCRSEGFQLRSSLVAMARRIQRVGGTITYLAMDEPLSHGYVNLRAPACHASIAALAHNAAHNILAMQRVMPGIQVGESEPGLVTSVSATSWARDLGAWAADFTTASGRPLAFVQFDIAWGSWGQATTLGTWQAAVRKDATALQAHGVSYGAIYDASRTHNDQEWATQTQENYTHFEQLGLTPKFAFFISWAAYPTRVLPVSNPISMTGIVRAYIQYRSGQGS